jgi:hypothetical protein
LVWIPPPKQKTACPNSDLENLKVQAEGISAKLKQAESEFNEFLDMTTKRAGM